MDVLFLSLKGTGATTAKSLARRCYWMKPACRIQCWTGTTGEKLHDSIFNFSFVTVSSGMHLQSSLMMMMMIIILIVHNVLQNLTAGSAFELNPSRRTLACPPIICTIQYTFFSLNNYRTKQWVFTLCWWKCRKMNTQCGMMKYI